MKRLAWKRLLLVLVCALLMTCMTFSLIFVLACSNHTCDGGCLICLQLAACWRTLRLLGAVSVFALLCLLLLRGLPFMRGRVAACLRAVTLVSLKVKLTD